MAGKNVVDLIGNIGKMPFTKEIEGTNKNIMFVELAVTEIWTDKTGNRRERTDWLKIKIPPGIVASTGKFLHTGQLIQVDAKIRTWITSGNGITNNRIERWILEATKIRMLKNAIGWDPEKLVLVPTNKAKIVK